MKYRFLEMFPWKHEMLQKYKVPHNQHSKQIYNHLIFSLPGSLILALGYSFHLILELLIYLQFCLFF